jgi:hypothetical protein
MNIDQIVIDLHNIARRVENNGNPDGIGYSIREIADRLNHKNDRINSSNIQRTKRTS